MYEDVDEEEVVDEEEGVGEAGVEAVAEDEDASAVEAEAEAEVEEKARFQQRSLKRNLALTSQRATVVLERVVDISIKKMMMEFV